MVKPEDISKSKIPSDLLTELLTWDNQFPEISSQSDLRFNHRALALLVNNLKGTVKSDIKARPLEQFFVIAGPADLNSLLPQLKFNQNNTEALILIRPFIHSMVLYLRYDVENKEFQCIWFDSQALGDAYKPNCLINKTLLNFYPNIHIFPTETALQPIHINMGCSELSILFLEYVLKNRDKESKYFLKEFESYCNQYFKEITKNSTLQDLNEEAVFISKIKAQRQIYHNKLKNIIKLIPKQDDWKVEVEKIVAAMHGLLLDKDVTLERKNVHQISFEQKSDRCDLVVKFSNQDELLYSNFLVTSAEFYPKKMKLSTSTLLLNNFTISVLGKNYIIKAEVDLANSCILYTAENIEILRRGFEDFRNQYNHIYWFSRHMRQSLALTDFFREALEEIQLAYIMRDDVEGLQIPQIAGAMKHLCKEYKDVHVIYGHTNAADQSKFIFKELEIIANKSNIKYIFFPYAVENHALLIVINNAQSTIEVYDSQNRATSYRINKSIFPKSFGKYEIKTGINFYLKQERDWECGIYAILTVLNIAQNIPRSKERLSQDQLKDLLRKFLRAANIYAEIAAQTAKIQEKNRAEKTNLLEIIENIRFESGAYQKGADAADILKLLADALQIELWGNLLRGSNPTNNEGRQQEQIDEIRFRSLEDFVKEFVKKHLASKSVKGDVAKKNNFLHSLIEPILSDVDDINELLSMYYNGFIKEFADGREELFKQNLASHLNSDEIEFAEEFFKISILNRIADAYTEKLALQIDETKLNTLIHLENMQERLQRRAEDIETQFPFLSKTELEFFQKDDIELYTYLSRLSFDQKTWTQYSKDQLKIISFFIENYADDDDSSDDSGDELTTEEQIDARNSAYQQEIEKIEEEKKDCVNTIFTKSKTKFSLLCDFGTKYFFPTVKDDKFFDFFKMFIDEKNEFGETLLDYYIRTENHISTIIVDNIITYGAPLDSQNKDGHSPLHQAIHVGNFDLALHLMDNHGAKINFKDNNLKQFKLVIAVRYQDIPLIIEAIKEGATFSTGKVERDLYQRVLRELLSQKIFKFADHKLQQDLFSHCLTEKAYEAIEYLLKENICTAHGNYREKADELYFFSPLHQAVWENDEKMVQLLVNYGATQFFIQDHYKHAPFDVGRLGPIQETLESSYQQNCLPWMVMQKFNLTCEYVLNDKRKDRLIFILPFPLTDLNNVKKIAKELANQNLFTVTWYVELITRYKVFEPVYRRQCCLRIMIDESKLAKAREFINEVDSITKANKFSQEKSSPLVALNIHAKSEEPKLSLTDIYLHPNFYCSIDEFTKSEANFAIFPYKLLFKERSNHSHDYWFLVDIKETNSHYAFFLDDDEGKITFHTIEDAIQNLLNNPITVDFDIFASESKTPSLLFSR